METSTTKRMPLHHVCSATFCGVLIGGIVAALGFVVWLIIRALST